MNESLEFAVEILDEFGVSDFPVQRVIAAIHYVLARHEADPGSGISVVVASNEKVREMNAQYRSVDAVTDILSFPADPLPDEIEGEAPYLGDLIIAYPYTAHQAQEAGHSLEDELVLLVIHGTLHLLGYDHDNETNQDAMWRDQADALAAAGVKIDVPRFTFEDDRGT